MNPPDLRGMAEPEDPPAGQTLLIVDDDSVVRSLMRDTLEDDGYTVIEAENGVEVRERCAGNGAGAARRRRGDAQHMDGFELCRVLRKQPQTAQVPILMATGLDDADSIARAYEVGATDFIAKPLNWLMLSQRIRYMLRAAHAFDELRQNQERLVLAKNAAEAANKAKSEFLANMSHELRTPLNAIIGFASIMQQGIRGPIDGHYVDDAKIIVDSGSHLLAIINDILDIAKAEAEAARTSPRTWSTSQKSCSFSTEMVVEMAKTGRGRLLLRGGQGTAAILGRRQKAPTGADQSAVQRDQVHPGRRQRHPQRRSRARRRRGNPHRRYRHRHRARADVGRAGAVRPGR